MTAIRGGTLGHTHIPIWTAPQLSREHSVNCRVQGSIRAAAWSSVWPCRRLWSVRRGRIKDPWTPAIVTSVFLMEALAAALKRMVIAASLGLGRVLPAILVRWHCSGRDCRG